MADQLFIQARKELYLKYKSQIDGIINNAIRKLEYEAKCVRPAVSFDVISAQFGSDMDDVTLATIISFVIVPKIEKEGYWVATHYLDKGEGCELRIGIRTEKLSWTE